MNLGARLKAVRESLGYSQREMVKALKSSLGAWQAYEGGKSVPGGNVLESLARLGFNVNWLLTGNGDMLCSDNRRLELAPHPGGAMASKFKLIRGELSFRDFALKFGLILEADVKKWEAELRAIEEGKVEPDWVLLSCLCYRFGISPSWLIEDEGPMYKKDVAHEPKPTRYEDLDENGMAAHWEEEQKRFNRVSNLIDECFAKYHLDPVREKRGNLTMTLFHIFGDKFCDDKDKHLKSTVNTLVRLCIPDEFYANIDEVNFYIGSAHHSIEENNIDDAREKIMKSAQILAQLAKTEGAEWPYDMQAARDEHLEFVRKDAGYNEGIKRLLPLIRKAGSVREVDLAKECPDMPPKLISYILFFAATQGLVERTQRGRDFIIRLQ